MSVHDLFPEVRRLPPGNPNTVIGEQPEHRYAGRYLIFWEVAFSICYNDNFRGRIVGHLFMNIIKYALETCPPPLYGVNCSRFSALVMGTTQRTSESKKPMEPLSIPPNCSIAAQISEWPWPLPDFSARQRYQP